MSAPGEVGPYKRDIPENAVPAGPASKPQALPPAPVTKLIVALNTIVFLVMATPSYLHPDAHTMLQWGADHGPETLVDGQYWRILSSTFLHFDPLHIASNMYALWSVGLAAEYLYGSQKFLFIYLIAGVLASLTSLYFSPQAVSAGASGAVFGAFGALWIFLRRHAKSFDASYIKSATRSIVFLLILNLAWGLRTPGIDNFAHIGGFVFGALAGWACTNANPRSRAWSTNNLIGAVALIALCYYGLHMVEEHYVLKPRAQTHTHSTNPNN
jgi:membrane associated rhomboid family serine protease